MKVCWLACALVKSASVELCFFCYQVVSLSIYLLGQDGICRALFSSVIKWSLYIFISFYMYLCLLQDWSLLIILDGAKLMANLQVCWLACALPIVCLVKSASVEPSGLLACMCFAKCLLAQECICKPLFSSVIKWSLSLYTYIYMCLLQDWSLLITLDGAKFDGKVPSGLLACM